MISCESVSQQIFTAKQVLEHEAIVAKNAGIEMYALMEQAGLAVFEQISKNTSPKQLMLVLVGKGNNGGDGLVIARLAAIAGYQVKVALLTKVEALQGDAKQAYENLVNHGAISEKLTIQPVLQASDWRQIIDPDKPDIIVDAMFGIGFYGQLPKLFEQIIIEVNRRSAFKVAVDIPSGVNATTGDVVSEAFNADVTVTFIALKQGLFTGQAPNYIGDVKFDGLGLNQAFERHVSTAKAIQTKRNAPKIPPRPKTAHKGTIGLLLAIGGNQGMPGAIKLASQSALRSGAALVSVLSHESNHIIIHTAQAELMIAGKEADDLANTSILEKAKTVLIGPGLASDVWARKLFKRVLSNHNNKPMVVDADALNLLSEQHYVNPNWVLTPHPKEAARLLGCSAQEVEQDRFAAALNIAQKYGGICVLKGAGSVIAHGQSCWVNTSGNASMASGGMGDVLSGIIAALLMQFDDKLAAVRLAVFLHGYIADQIVGSQGPVGLLASDIVAQLPIYINKFL